MNTRVAAAMFAGFFVSACTSGVAQIAEVPQSGPQLMNRMKVVTMAPTPDLKVGRIYRNKAGGEDSISIAGGQQLLELCPDDFAQIDALKLVESAVSTRDAGSNGGSFHQVVSLKPKIGGLGWDILIGNISGEYTTNAKIEYAKLSIVEAPPAARSVVLQSIGRKCRNLIAEHRRAGRSIYVIGRAIRTAEATVTISGKVGIGVGTTPGRVGPSASQATPGGEGSVETTEVFKQDNAYIGLSLGAPVR